ncbi:acid phosphatase [Corynebacterium pseudopelargi]|uniref:Major phosphate-irrepressible acid phosphatase n=1 Tax=Corynebacterium pseudopelargi TaxID=2080757 RepID=A0A3G6IWE0_9CORY|nr:phosphatase PAP2 family protein [Corynebacterium pseudopelargi]AZA08400.1 Major phosphate-irrepressible acid phosphatase precursor [Corynebacterium pseudopelargi]
MLRRFSVALFSSMLLLAPHAHAQPAPQPEPFGIDAYLPYESDRSSYPDWVYTEVVSEFRTLNAEYPDVMESNLQQVIEVNNYADPDTIARAQSDAATDTEGVLGHFADAFGPTLGQHFRDALAEGRLPKTKMMFDGIFARAGGLASSTFIEKAIFANERPYIAHPDKIKRYDVEGKDIYPTSKSFPSGHTNQAAWTTTLLAVLVPEAAPQLLERGSEAGYHRMVLGVHYPLDVIGGRMTGNAAAADRWNDPRMRENLKLVGQEIRAELEWRCGATLRECVDAEAMDPDRAVALYTERMNYGFTPIASQDAPINVPKQAPDLLLGVFPELSYDQRASILVQTAGPAGMPLDHQEGSWQRINLAKAMNAQINVAADGTVTVLN